MADKRLSTPVGTAVFPRLKTPDTKFDDLGIYKADVALPKADAMPLMDELTVIFKGHTGKAPKASENTMWYFETDKDSGEETGNVVFKIRVKNRMRKDGKLWDRRPKLFSADLKPIDVDPYGGTKYSVAFDVYEWDAGGKKGVSLQPAAVQIIDLVKSTGGSGESFGFGAQEGYTVPVADGAEDFVPQDTDDSVPEDGDY